MYSNCYSCQVLMKIGFSRQILENPNIYIRFHEIHLLGAELFHEDSRKDRETDRQTQRSEQSLFAIFPGASNYSAYRLILL